MTKRWGESGNIFFTLFGAVALVGVVGAATSTLMRGPVGTVVALNQRAKADSQMQIAMKLAMLEAQQRDPMSVPPDCDADNLIEPTAPGAALTGLVGGGQLPSVGSTTNDPWGRPYGYCGWDHGDTGGSIIGGGCANATGSQPLLNGVAGAGGVVIAVISAGPDRVFGTTCNSSPASSDAYFTRGANGADDIIVDMTYAEANEASGGLWYLQSGDPNSITTGKSLDVQQGAQFSSGDVSFNSDARFGGAVDLRNDVSNPNAGWFFLPDETGLLDADCNGGTATTNAGAMRRKTSGGSQVLQICDPSDVDPVDDNWADIGGAGATLTAAGDPGEIQFNDGGVIGASPNLAFASAGLYIGVDANITGDLDVGSDADVDGTLSVAGATTLTTTLDVDGAADFDSTIDVASDATFGGWLRGANGTNTAPTFSFTADTDTGIYYASGGLGFSAGGTTGMIVSSSGFGAPNGNITTNLDVGGVLTTGSLAVNDDITADRFISRMGTTTAALPGFETEPGTGMFSAVDNTLSLVTGGSTRFIIDGTGDVGINVASPDATLDVGGEIKIGTSSVPCGATIYGAVRYVSGDLLQVCSSMTNDWEDIGTSGGGGGGAASYWTRISVADPRLYYTADFVGVGTNNPLDDFHVNGDLLVTGSYSGTPGVAVSGGGARMFFDPESSAFRVGGVNGTQWDNGNIGGYSIGLGFDVIASGLASGAFGQEVSATGPHSFAYGLGDATGAAPLVSGTNSYGIFMGDQSGINLAANNTMALLGGRFLIDQTPSASPAASGTLSLDVEGGVGAIQYCDEDGLNCFTAESVATGGVGAPGTNREVVFNSNGVLGTDPNFTFSSAGNLTLGGTGAVKVPTGDGTNRPAVPADGMLRYNTVLGRFEGYQGGQWRDLITGTAIAAGANTQIQFNSNNNMWASAAFTFNQGEVLVDGAPYGKGGVVRIRGAETPAANYLDATLILESTASSGIWSQTLVSNIPSRNGDLVFAHYDGSTWQEPLVLANDGKVGIFSTNPRASLDINTTDAILLPIGNVANRPAAPVNGMLRYNSQSGKFEGFQGGIWQDILTSAVAGGAAAPNRGIQFNSNGSFAASTSFQYTSGGSFLTTGTYSGAGDSSLPTGAGTRMFYDPSKAAFRAGHVTGNNWDNANVGAYSIAWGFDTRASGISSYAFGQLTNASGNNSLAMGATASATGHYSMALGSSVIAGNGTAASGFGDGSMAIGLIDQGSVTVSTPSQVRGDMSLGIFMGDQDGLVMTANNTMGLFGGRFVMDPRVPAQQLTPRADFDLGASTDAILFPTGQISNRPAAPVNGMMRYNSVSGKFEAYQAGSWNDIVTTGGGGIAINDLTDAISNTTSTVFLGTGSGTVSTGSGNTGVGINAMASNVAKQENTAVGLDAMRYANSSAVAGISFNTALGAYALRGSTTAANNIGTNNTALGHSALFTFTSGGYNTAVGGGALYANTTGSRNSAFGETALYSNVAKEESTAIGHAAMYYADNSAISAITYNTAVGAYALRGSTTAANNTGAYNTSMGHSSMLGNTSGSNNTAIGGAALSSNTTGSKNTAVGERSLDQNVAKEESTAIGFEAMRYSDSSAVTATTFNTAVGAYALRGSTTPANNTGINNTAVGHSALVNNTAGQNNVAVGWEALSSNTTGSTNIWAGNVAVGSQALKSATIAELNTALGNRALTLATGSHNTAIGGNSLSAVTTGGSNIAIGSDSGTNITTGSWNIAIGVGVTVPLATGSDQLNIGNLITGTMDQGLMQINGTGALTLPIGQTGNRPAGVNGMIRYNSVTGKFEGYQAGAWQDILTSAVSGGAAAPNRGIQFNSGGSFTADANFVFTSTGAVGIGTNSPTVTLDVRGTGIVTGNSTGSSFLGAYGSGNGTVYSVLNLADVTTNRVWSINHAQLYPNEMVLNYDNGLGTTTNTAFFKPDGRINFGSTGTVNGGLRVDVDGSLGATQYCDSNGLNCFLPGNVGVPASPVRGIQFNSGGAFAADSNFVYTSVGDLIVGSSQKNDLPGFGDYSRLFFDKAKGAFRAGSVGSTEWDDVNVGYYSTAMGVNVRASGSYSLALGGRYATATNTDSVALGSYLSSSGIASLATGYGSVASGDYSIAMGKQVSSTASGAMGIGLVNNLTTITTSPIVSGTQSLGIFMGDQDGGINFAAANTMGLFGGNMVIDPRVPAQQLTARSVLDLGAATDSIVVPAGTTAQRPASPVNGMIRYNSQNGKFEGYQAGAWQDILTSGASTSIDALTDAITNYTSNNIFMGQNNGALTTTGQNNTAVGSSTLRDLTTGDANAAFGARALERMTTGYANTAMGWGALQYHTNTYENTAIGNAALGSSNAGSFNTAIGSLVLPDSTGGANTGVGARAGIGLTTGTENTLLGHRVATNLTTGSYNILIGSSLDALSATADHQLRIGNLLTGTLNAGLLAVNGTGAITVPVGQTGNRPAGVNGMIRYNSQTNRFEGYQAGAWQDLVTIGTAPGAAAPNRGIQFNSGGNFAATNDFVYSSTGNLGIGTGSPAVALEVRKESGSFPEFRMGAADVTLSNWTGSATLNAVGANTFFETRMNRGALNNTNNKGGAIFHGISAAGVNDWTPLYFLGTQGGNTPTAAAVVIAGQKHNGTTNRTQLVGAEPILDVRNFYEGGDLVMRLRADGFVGLGTATPQAQLDIAGTGAVLLPRGTTAQQPAGVNGMIRYNSQTNKFEGYQAGAWQDILTGAGGAAGPDRSIQFNSGGLLTGSADASLQPTHFEVNTELRVRSSSFIPATIRGEPEGWMQVTASGGRSGMILTPGNSWNTWIFTAQNASHTLDIMANVGNVNAAGHVLSLDGSASGNVTMHGTGALRMPAGATADRPGAPVNGMIRYNSQTGKFEGYQAGAWQDIVTGGGAATSIDALTDAIANYTSGNMYLGQGNGDNTTTGNDNTALGNNALGVITTGRYNTALGSYALSFISSGDFNTGIGYAALQNNSQSFNTAIGYRTLRANTTGAENTAMGYMALDANTTGVYNTATGSGALDANTTGNQNTAFGVNALGANVTGNGGLAIGYNALAANTLGGNLAVGNSAMTYNNGYTNTAVGNQAIGGFAGSATNTVAVGFSAMSGLTNGNNNTGVGRDALVGVSTGADNVGLGYNVGSNLTTGSFNIGIGSGITFASTTGSYQLNIGNLITGTMNTGLMQINGTGALTLPIGQTGNRPTGVNGMIRYNSQTNKFEGYQGGVWTDIITAGGSAASPDRGIQFNSGGAFGASSNLTFTSAGALTLLSGEITVDNLVTMSAPSGYGLFTVSSPVGGVALDSYGDRSPHIGIFPQNAFDPGNYYNAAMGMILPDTGLENGILMGDGGGSAPAATGITFYDPAVGTFGIGGLRFKTNHDGLNLVTRMQIDPQGIVSFTSTGAMIMNAGTTAQRPSSPVNGMIRYNSQTNKFEGYQAGAWADIITGAATSTFLSLTDTPSSYAAQGGKFVRVNTGATALEFTDEIVATVTGPAPTAPNLDYLGDVTITTPTAGQILTYSSGQWINTTNSGGGGGSIDALSDGKTDYPDESLFLGQNSGNALTSGTRLTAVGSNAMASATAVSTSVAMGAGALSAMTQGFNHIAIGDYAMGNFTSIGGNNIAIGTYAMSAASGFDNVIIGTEGLLSASGSNNTGVGIKALTAVTSGSRNTVLGYQAGDNITSGSNNIVIGYDLDAASATGSYQLNIGGLLTGTTNAGLLQVNGTGAVTLPIGGSGNRPTGVNGMIRYNSQTNKFEGYQAGSWQDIITGAASGTFLALTDTPSAYAGAGGQYVRVNSGATALEFTDQIVPSVSGQPAPTNTIIDDLGDVTITTPTAGQILTYSSGTWINAAAGAGGSGTPAGANTQIQFNSNGAFGAVSGLTWTNGTTTLGVGGRVNLAGQAGNAPVSQVLPINNLSDVTITSPSNGQTLFYSGGQWVNGSGGGGGGSLDALSDAKTNYGIDENIWIGQNAGNASAATGGLNTVIGIDAGDAITTGGSNTGVGYRVLGSAVTAAGNSAFGTNALTLTTASNNSAFGANAMASNTVGTENVAIGRSALNTNVGGNQSTAVGFEAMRYANSVSGATTTYNTALGAFALRGSTTASANTGTGNTAIGHNSMYNNTSGSRNVGLGHGTLYFNSSGNDNTGLGYYALAANTTGVDNTAIGSYALDANSTGSANVAIGQSTLTASNSGGNTAVGAYVMPQATSGQNNTAFGSAAGWAVNTGSNNTFFGYQAGNNVTSGSNNIAIGYDIDPASATGSYQLNIGNLITGTTNAGLMQIVGTGALTLPIGSNGNRPTGVNGMIRYNSATNKFEGYQNSAWTDIMTSASGGAFLTLTDTPSSYAGQANKFVRVNSGASALEFTDQVVTSYSGVPAPAAINLSNLGDTTIASPTNGQILTYSAGKWINGTGGGGGGTIDALSDAKTDYVTGDNFWLGQNAGNAIIAGGNFNLAIGENAGDGITTGDNNVAIGHNSLTATVTGGYNIAIGKDSLQSTTSGSDNMAIGDNTLSANTSGYGNVAIGSSTGSNITTGANNILIGSNILASGAAVSSQLNIGGTIYGDMATDRIGIGALPATGVELDVTGDIQYTGTITDVSDMRLKDNITPLNTRGSMLDKLDQIGTYSFTMKDDTEGQVEFGVMAQEINKVFPELVKVDDSTADKYMSVNYVGMIAPLIEASKELKAENEDLKAKLSTIEERMASLEGDMNGVKAHTGYGISKAQMGMGMMLGMLVMAGMGGMFLMVLRRRKQG